jgi:hypothetical protein
VLIGDVADDLLDDVLERDEAHHLAIFIDHQGEMRFAPEEGGEQVGHAPRVGHEPGGLDDGLDGDAGGIALMLEQCSEEILHMQDADDVVRDCPSTPALGCGRSSGPP